MGAGFGGGGRTRAAGDTKDYSGDDAKRVLLGFATSGTSEIKTGGGQYGDETVADSLFPKTVNDWALEDRQAGRQGVDAAKQTEVDQAATAAALQPDAADAALKAARRQGAMRLMSGNGRKSSFITASSSGY